MYCIFFLLIVSVGGLAAVIYTDTLQAFVMLIGALILTVLSKLPILLVFMIYTRYIASYQAIRFHDRYSYSLCFCTAFVVVVPLIVRFL